MTAYANRLAPSGTVHRIHALDSTGRPVAGCSVVSWKLAEMPETAQPATCKICSK